MDIKEESDKIPFMLMEQIGINEQLKEELDKKDKIINEMAEDIRRYEIDAGYENTYKNKEEVIDYFTKKVEGK